MMFTAHIREMTEEEQSVFEHSVNTARFSADFLRAVQLSSTGMVAGLLHDAGKLSVRFDDYIHGRSDVKRGEIDHSFAGAKFLIEVADRSTLAAAILIAHTIVSHHAVHDWIDVHDDDYLTKRISKKDDYDEIAENIRGMLSDAGVDIDKLLKDAVSEIMGHIRRYEKKERAFYIGMLERLVQSALIDSDRIDTADFMAGRSRSSSYDLYELWNEADSRLDEKLGQFEHFSDEISAMRRTISDRCAFFAEHKVGVCRLIVPTGGGKTLSSLRFAVKQCRRYGMERIFYIAPFMSILEQNSDVIRSLVGSDCFLEHHSNIIAEIDSENEYNEYQLHAERWDKPVIATTMVQFLNSLFSAKTSSVRRMHRLCNSVIIIDEVQSVPIKCVDMFSLAVNFLAKSCGCSVVLCSATQPTFEKNDHRIIFDEMKDMIPDYKEYFTAFKRTELISSVTKFGYDNEQAANFCYDRFKENGDLLLVVNTKAQASELYRFLKEKAADEAYIIHLSTNMCPAHRKKRIGTLKRFLDKHKPVICVTTQLIEAGVDISFRCVVRTLAGLDNAAQAAGRCNRNGENAGLCPVYLINMKDESLGKLEEIKNAQSVSRDLLKYSSGELLSAEMQSEYFTNLYSLYGDKLSYQTKLDNKTVYLLDLLSFNKSKYGACRSEPKPDKYMVQSFKTAGQLFEVIDSRTLNVIVPYDKKARELISKMLSEPSFDEFERLLRKAQKYTVGIYKGTEIKLRDTNALCTRVVNGCEITMLEKEFYSIEFGVTLEGAERELLMF